uniref:Uncharacterized protein n=1 Tax=Aegilops tauschii subsp. strangulata TaxID=200361 RepID=A0A453NTK5_AEGTS
MSQLSAQFACVVDIQWHVDNAEAVLLGGKNAAIAGTVVAVPTLVACRVLPWAKHNLNYTAQALIISAACIAGFFITADKTILRNARQNTIGRIDKST